MQPHLPTAGITTPSSKVSSLDGSRAFYIHPGAVVAPAITPPPQPAVVQSAVVQSAAVQSAVVQSAVVQPAVEAQSQCSSYFQSKRYFDRLITAVLMTAALPIMAMISIAVLICDGRPITFRQVRVGKDGRTFRILKFRTMRHDAEARTGAVWSSATDTRVTRLGRWLRCTHLDELPQFFNVLCGEMNLIGPRPERPEFVETLTKEVPGYLQRTQVRPGITGLAQLKLGYDESITGVPQKLACDMEYIRNASLPGDLALLSKTLPHIAGQLYDRLRPKSATYHSPSQQKTVSAYSTYRSPSSDLRRPDRCLNNGSFELRRVSMTLPGSSTRLRIKKDVA